MPSLYFVCYGSHRSGYEEDRIHKTPPSYRRGAEPLTKAMTPGASIWNGTTYTTAGGERKPDPYALAWWSTLSAIADLIDAQEAALSEKQIAYLDRLLFGGMGSLSDLSFDPESVGNVARTINDRLDKQTRALHACLRGD